jgi:exonuclease SbcD
MFKFLHTADLHLGKVFHDQNLGEDQAVMLGELSGILEDGSYAALVIAGDVYDRSIASPEAIELFSSFLGEIKKRQPSLEVLIIPGNHDSASRLGFGRELFARLGIRFGVSAEDCDKPVIVERDGESCAFFLLPFLNPGVLSRDVSENGPMPLRSQSALAEEAARRMEKARQALGGIPSVLAAHLFTTGGLEVGSERVFLGSAELVNIELFKGFDYIALGHLHRCQCAGKNAWYSGSPLAYSFGEDLSRENEKCFLSVTLGKDAPKVEKIPVKPRRKVTSFCGPFDRFAGDISTDKELLAVADDYLEIRLTDRRITENAREILRKRFPHLLSLRQDEALAELSSGARFQVPGGETRGGGRRDVSADFRDFLLDLYGKAAGADISADMFMENSTEVSGAISEIATEISRGISPEISDELELFNKLLAEIESPDAQNMPEEDPS